MEQRACVYCGELFDVNRRSAATHVFCQRQACQRERKRLGQRARRAEKPAPALSMAGKQARARYMCGYRATRPRYREHDRCGRAARRMAARPAPAAVERAVTEAGSNDRPAKVYLVTGSDGAIRLRVVAEAGKGLTVGAEVTWPLTASAVTEAG